MKSSTAPNRILPEHIQSNLIGASVDVYKVVPGSKEVFVATVKIKRFQTGGIIMLHVVQLPDQLNIGIFRWNTPSEVWYYRALSHIVGSQFSEAAIYELRLSLIQ